MTLSSRSIWVVRLVTQAYYGFLTLYPVGFRAQHGQEMKDLFEERCLEAYETAGMLGIGRWLLKILAGEVMSLYKEYLTRTADLIERNRDAQKALALGMIFLVGTWGVLFFMAARLVLSLSGTVSFATGALPGILLVLANALLVARSITRSERIEYVAGMAAMANTFLIATLMAIQSSLESLPSVALLVQVVLIRLHGHLLWKLRGDEMTQSIQELKIGE
jgi:hypothetical protein